MRSLVRSVAVGLVIGLLVLAGLGVASIAPTAGRPSATAVALVPSSVSPSSPPRPGMNSSTISAQFPNWRDALPVPIRTDLVSSSTVSNTTPAAAPSSPVVRAGWTGLGSVDNGNLTPYPNVSPPDVQVAVGPSHVVEMVNLVFAMWTKQGVRVKDGSLMAFFGVPTNEFISDPKIQYDAASGRWFATITDVATGSNVATGLVLLAVSSSSDPTGTWRIVKIPSSATGECLDQPILGVGSSTVIVSVNVFSSCLSNKFTYKGAQYWVLSKADLVSGSSSPATQSFGPYASTASFHPAQVIGASTTDFLVSANAFDSSVNSIELFRVSGAPPSATVSTTNLSVRTIAPPPQATQPGGGGTLPVDTGDFRVQDAVWSAGNLWLGLSDRCTPVGDNQARSCVRLIEINTTTTTVAQDFDIGSAARYYFYPALRADGAGNLLVVFGYSSASDFPGLMAATRVFGDPLGTLDPPTVIVAGTGDESLGCSTSAGSCRYGDYFGAGLDPSNSSMIWAAGEFADGAGWWTRIFAGSVKATLTLSYSIANGGAGYAPPEVTYTLDGGVRTATLSTTPTSFAADPGTRWSVATLLQNPSVTGNPAPEVWALNGGTSSGVVNASLVASFTYYHQYLFDFGFSVSDNSTVTAPTIQVQSFGSPVTISVGTSRYVDADSNFSYPNPLPGSTSQERWTLGGSSNGTVLGTGAFAGLYYHQFSVSFAYVLQGASSGPAPTVHYDNLGANVSVHANATVWADAGRPYVYQSSLTGEGGYVRIGAGAGSVGTVSATGTITVQYGLQYLLSVSVNPIALSSNVSGAGWYDAGAIATLVATTPNGWKFVGWSGAVSSPQATATVAMEAPENVTAFFYPGLTIIAGDGGSVSYSYGSVSGTVPSGGAVTIYAPTGTTVTLTAQPSSLMNAFRSWSGGATGSSATTSVTLGTPVTVSAAFGTDMLVVVSISVAVVAVIVAALLLAFVARRRKRQQPPS